MVHLTDTGQFNWSPQSTTGTKGRLTTCVVTMDIVSLPTGNARQGSLNQEEVDHPDAGLWVDCEWWPDRAEGSLDYYV